MQEFTQISGELSISYGPLSGSGAGEYLKNSISTSNKVSLVYYNRRSAYARVINDHDMTIKSDILPLINDGNDEDIYDRYGTKYVSSLTYGALLSVIFTVTSKTEIDFQDIKAGLQGGLEFGGLDLAFKAKFQQQTGEQSSQ